MSPRPPDVEPAWEPMSPRPPDVEIEFSVEGGLDGAWDESAIRLLVQAILARVLADGGGDFVIALHLVDDEAIRALNAQHRSKNVATDVLSFPLHDPAADGFVLPPGEPVNLGDVVVSLPRARDQARQFGHSLEREIGYLVAHGVLHVLGFDHEDAAERQRMRQYEEEALLPLGLVRE
jgi:probable rRNA maturation factor